MKINLEVTELDGAVSKVSAQFADFIAFEGEKNRSVANFQSRTTPHRPRMVGMARNEAHATRP
jgi:hypothetical protein